MTDLPANVSTLQRWQPIETAPKPSGVHEILLFQDYGDGSFVIKIGWWDGDKWNIREPFMEDYEWTHWMPLPEPPK